MLLFLETFVSKLKTQNELICIIMSTEIAQLQENVCQLFDICDNPCGRSCFQQIVIHVCFVSYITRASKKGSFGVYPDCDKAMIDLYNISRKLHFIASKRVMHARAKCMHYDESAGSDLLALGPGLPMGLHLQTRWKLVNGRHGKFEWAPLVCTLCKLQLQLNSDISISDTSRNLRTSK